MGKRVYTEEQKQVLRERLAKARAIKKKLKEERESKGFTKNDNKKVIKPKKNIELEEYNKSNELEKKISELKNRLLEKDRKKELKRLEKELKLKELEEEEEELKEKEEKNKKELEVLEEIADKAK